MITIHRGKTKAQIEFGPRLGASLDKGFASIFSCFNGIVGALAAVFELPGALTELKYQSDGKSGRLQYK